MGTKRKKSDETRRKKSENDLEAENVHAVENAQGVESDRGHVTARDDREIDRAKDRRSQSGREDRDRGIKDENQGKNRGPKRRKSAEKNQDQNHEKQNQPSNVKRMIRQLGREHLKKLRQWKLEKQFRNNSLGLSYHRHFHIVINVENKFE